MAAWARSRSKLEKARSQSNRSMPAKLSGGVWISVSTGSDGRYDGSNPPEITRDFAAQIPGLRCELLESGHGSWYFAPARGK